MNEAGNMILSKGTQFTAEVPNGSLTHRSTEIVFFLVFLPLFLSTVFFKLLNLRNKENHPNGEKKLEKSPVKRKARRITNYQ